MTDSSTIHPHYFCEMGISGDRMDCFDKLSSWIKNVPAIASGNLNSTKHRHRIIVELPIDDNSSNASITKLFENSILNSQTPK